jgi:hypothetical protein
VKLAFVKLCFLLKETNFLKNQLPFFAFYFVSLIRTKQEEGTTGVVLELEIKSIHIPWDLFPRVITGVVEDKVKEYAEMVKNGIEFDPILVWDKGNEYWVIDGVHRIEAYKRAGRPTIKAQLISCKDKTDYRIKAIQANLKHDFFLKKKKKLF